ncbi:MAG: hypothetical protein GXP55_06840 [Deltaproteobacteria bacterium]|nr:hypothetical protein [Deltaproteobacteria bacterium]
MSRSRTLSAVVLGTLALIFTAAMLIQAEPARATVMVEVSLDDMARDADAIVRGTITRTGVRLEFEAGRLEPYSSSELRVSEWLAGGTGDRLVIRERGGEWQGGGHWIDGTPQYRVGEEVIVFLQRDADQPGRYRTYAMAQGKFVVLRGVPGTGGQVRRDLEGMSFARWAGQGMQLEAGQAPVMALDTFLARIRAVRTYFGGTRPADELGGVR